MTFKIIFNVTGLFGLTPIDTYATNVLTVPRTRVRVRA